MSKIDLHIHSCFSDDGEFSPRQIVAQSKAKGLQLIAITDHNSVRGVTEAIDAAQGTLRVLSGVELDCTHAGRNYHLLGYGFDHTRPEFAAIEQDILHQEQQLAPEKIRLFVQATGVPVTLDEVLAEAQNGVVPGELIAQIVLAREDAAQYAALRPYLPGGERSDMPNVRFYWDFFAEGKVAYVPVKYLSLAEAVALIHDAGGRAVLAHPGQNLGSDTTPLAGIIAQGIDGIEAFSSYHNVETTDFYLSAATDNGLFVTCGSDFHGTHKPRIALGGHGASWDDERIAAGLGTLAG